KARGVGEPRPQTPQPLLQKQALARLRIKHSRRIMREAREIRRRGNQKHQPEAVAPDEFIVLHRAFSSLGGIWILRCMIGLPHRSAKRWRKAVFILTKSVRSSDLNQRLGETR